MGVVNGAVQLINDIKQFFSAPTVGSVGVAAPPWSFSVSSGTGTGQANRAYSATLTVDTTGADQDLTSLVGLDGVAIALNEVVYFSIELPADAAGYLKYKGGAANGWVGAGVGATADASDIVYIYPGELKILAANTGSGRYVVGASTKVFNLQAVTATVYPKVVIIGRDT